MPSETPEHPSITGGSDGLPLTPRQRMIWLENQLAPGLPINSEVCYLTVEGPLDIGLLQEAFRRLSLRHDALRAILRPAAKAGEAPLMGFTSAPATPLQHESIAPGALREHLATLADTPFGPSTPLVRASVYSEAADLHHICFVQSHLITDGRSMQLLFEDLSTLFCETRAGTTAAPADTFFENFMRNAGLQTAKEATFWDDFLRTQIPELRPYGVAPTMQRHLIHRIIKPVPRALSQRLGRRASGYGPSIILSAVTAAVVYRTTGEETVALGVPALNRPENMSQVAGLFMEIVPNRLSIQGDQSLNAIAAAVARQADRLRAFRGHAVSAAQSGHQVILNNYPPTVGSFAGLPATLSITTALEVIKDGPAVRLSGQPGPGINIIVFSDPDGRPFEIAFDFDRGRWPDVELHTRFADHFMAVLTAFDADPDQPIGAIDILSPSERAEALAVPRDWQPFPARLPGVVDMIYDAAQGRPDSPALIYEDQTFTYGQLIQRVDRIAAILVTHGAGPGALVAVCMDRSANLVLALIAVLRTGAAYIPLDPRHPPSRLSMIVEDADPVLLIADDDLDVSAIAESERVVRFSDLEKPGADATGLPMPEALDADPAAGLAYVIFTSGSTGRPKGVRVPHHGLSSFLLAMREAPGLTANDRLLSVTTVSFDIAALEIFLPLITGAVVHIAPYEATLDGAELARRMTAAGITVFQATPATYRLLLGADWQGPGVKALCGGEALPDDLAQRLIGACGELWNMYGPTETTIWSSVERVTAETLPVTIGRPIRGTRLTVRTVLGALCPPGTPGELNIAGDGVTDGYHDRAELTAEKFVPDTDAGATDAMGQDSSASVPRRYRTGDAVRQLPDGRISYIGRIDFQVKVRGFRIELGEIEAQIGQVPGVESAAVITFDDTSGETALAAYYVGDGSDQMQQTIRNHLATELPAYMRPAVLTHLHDMPLTPNGKTNRKALPAPDLSAAQTGAGDVANFADDLERSIAGAWEQVLGRTGIGPGANFFDQGGHSILALSLIGAVERATGVALDLGSVFAAPTVRGMAERVRSRAPGASSAAIALQGQGDGAALFCICGLEIYRPLAEALGPEGPVYGLYVDEEARFLVQAVSGSVADISIDVLATAYAEAIQRCQPAGPYRLTGVSFGGVLALETARVLEAAGHEVAGVTLLDTFRKDGRRTDWQRYLVAKLHKLTNGGGVQMLRNLASKLSRRLRGRDDGYVTVAGGDTLSPERLREIAFIKAMEAHEGSVRLNAPVSLIKAANRGIWGDGIVFDDDYGWGKALGRPVQVFEVEGDHLGILREPTVTALAQILRN